MPRRTVQPRNIACPVLGCTRLFTKRSGLTNHLRTHQTPQAGSDSEPDNTPQSPIFEEGPFDLGEGPGPANDDAEDTAATGGRETVTHHPLINGLPCDTNGNFLADGAPPPPWDHPAQDDFSPFEDRAAFELADLIFRRSQMSASHFNELVQIWASTLPDDQDPPFTNEADMYNTIDAIGHGSVPWQSFSVSFDQENAGGPDAPWKHQDFDVWFRDPRLVLKNQLGNQDFAKEMDYAPKEVRDVDDKRLYTDFMSGDWAWRQADEIAMNPDNHGATVCPVILGSDKTTVSVATGQNEYYPLYISNGLIHNNVRRAHRNGVTLLAFLAIPHTDREHQDGEEFRRFRRQIFHASLNRILQPLRQYMETPELVRYGDGYFRRTIYSLGPYIADYPEQVLLSCIVQGWCPRCDAHWDNLDENLAGRRSHELTETLFQALGTKALWEDYGIIDGIMPFTHGFPRADIHQLLSPDLLHQIIKGTFKDHLVTWVVDYIKLVNTPAEAKKVLADIDRRIAAAPSFPGLRRFPEGRGFKQWTGDDSKALMKVFLPAISGHVPSQMVQAISSFMEFCYLVRRSVISEDDIGAINDAIDAFHTHRVAFDAVRPDGYSLPRQHSLIHYPLLIREFGAPNGLCSSITESKHIKAVKEPWRRSSRFEALGQMLVTNERLDKLAAARVDFMARGMLNTGLFGPPPEPPPAQILDDDDDDDDGGAVDGKVSAEVILAKRPVRGLSHSADALAVQFDIPNLPALVSRFLYEQQNPDIDIDIDNVPLDECPEPSGKIRVFPSAIAIYYAPSDKSGTRGMIRERIRAVDSWRKGPPRHDCVFVSQDPAQPGFKGFYVARVRLFLSIRHRRITHPCALVEWFSTVGQVPCPDTGLWMVEPDFDILLNPARSIIHLDSISRGAHLMGVLGEHDRVPRHLKFHQSLDAFSAFYVNKYIDHHAHELVF